MCGLRDCSNGTVMCSVYTERAGGLIHHFMASAHDWISCEIFRTKARHSGSAARYHE